VAETTEKLASNHRHHQTIPDIHRAAEQRALLIDQHQQ
jgi:hypothetical protein